MFFRVEKPREVHGSSQQFSCDEKYNQNISNMEYRTKAPLMWWWCCFHISIKTKTNESNIFRAFSSEHICKILSMGIHSDSTICVMCELFSFNQSIHWFSVRKYACSAFPSFSYSIFVLLWFPLICSAMDSMYIPNKPFSRCNVNSVHLLNNYRNPYVWLFMTNIFLSCIRFSPIHDTS